MGSDRPEEVAGPVGGPGAWDVRAARWSDLRAIRKLYLGLPDEERLLYHPFPFRAARLTLLLAGLILLRGVLPHFARLFPRGAALLVLARQRADGSLVALGTLNFARGANGGALAARTGLYVQPTFRRLGAGGSINDWMLERARTLGARRAEALIVARNEPSLALFGSMGYQIGPSAIYDRRPPFEPFLLAERSLE